MHAFSRALWVSAAWGLFVLRGDAQELTFDPGSVFEGNWEVIQYDKPKPGQKTVSYIAIARDWPMNSDPAWTAHIDPGQSRPPRQWIRARNAKSDLIYSVTHNRNSIGNVGVIAPRVGGDLEFSYPYKGGNAAVHLTGPMSVEGQWIRGDRSGAEKWHRVFPRLTEIQWEAAGKQRVKFGKELGRLETNYNPDDWVRGNRPGWRVEIYGENLWGHHVAWVDGTGVEAFDCQPLPPTATGKNVRGISVSGVFWSDATPGRRNLRLDELRIPFDLVVNGYPKDKEPSFPERLLAPEIRFRTSEEPGDIPVREILRDEPFYVDLTLPKSVLPRKAGGTVDFSKIPREQTATFVLPQQRGTVDFTLKFQGGTRWSTPNPITILRGAPGDRHVTLLGIEMPLPGGGVGALDVRDGEYFTARYETATAEVRAFETALKEAIALQREGFLTVLREMIERLSHQGFTDAEMAAINDPKMPPEMRTQILANAPSPEELAVMKRKLAYAGHALALIDNGGFELDTTKYEIARVYANLVRYPQAGNADQDTLPGGSYTPRPGSGSLVAFDLVNRTERLALNQAIENAKDARQEALIRGARDCAMGFYQWTLEESGAGDFVMFAGLNPMTGKPATDEERAEAAGKILFSVAMNKIQSDALARAQDGTGTTGYGSRTDVDPNAPRTGANPTVAAPTTAPRPTASAAAGEISAPPTTSGKPLAAGAAPAPKPTIEFPRTSAAPAPAENLALSETAGPRRPDINVPAKPKPTIEYPPPRPEAPSEALTRPLPENAAARRPDINVPPRPNPANEASPAVAASETATRPLPVDAAPARAKPTIEYPKPPLSSETVTRPLPAPTETRGNAALPPIAGAEAAAGGTNFALSELRHSSPPSAVRRWNESEAVLDNLVRENPRLAELDRSQLSTYLGVHAGRANATPAQLAAEAANYHGGRVTPAELAHAADLPPPHAEHALAEGWRSMRVDGVDVHHPPPVRPPAPIGSGPPPKKTGAPALPTKVTPIKNEVTPLPPQPGDSAGQILDRLNVPGLNRAQADAYIASNRQRPGISDVQLAAEAVRNQGKPVLGRQLSQAAGLSDPLAGNAELRKAIAHLGMPPQVRTAAATGSLRSSPPDYAAEWLRRNLALDDARAGQLRERRLQFEQRAAAAPPLPPQPPGVPGNPVTPQRYMVEDDIDYLNRIMAGTQLRPSQERIRASRVNELVDSMLAPGPRPIPPNELPVRISDGLVGEGHHRVIAARIVSLRTGRPMFASQGPNAILPDPAPLLQRVAVEERAVEWRLAVDP